MATARLYTLGYGNLTPDKLFAIIPDDAVLIDVRAYPDKARIDEFTRSSLISRFSRGRGVERYLWFHELGNRSRSMPPDLIDPQKGIERLLKLMDRLYPLGFVPCLFCAEGNPFEPDGITPRCHRVVVANLLREMLGDLEIIHLVPSRQTNRPPSLFD